MKKFMYSSMAVALLAAAAVAQESTEPEAIYEDDCVAFVNGLGNYGETCIKSGLLHMAENTCYTMNADRSAENPKWINNDASQTWWWTPVACTKHEVPPQPIIEYTYEPKGCIAFENGTGDYDQHCYSEGLLNMAEGKCYVFNTDRLSDYPGATVPTWINNIATETWWWVETECFNAIPVSSSSVEPTSSSSSVTPVSSADVDCSQLDPTDQEYQDRGCGASSSSVEPASSADESSSSVAPTSSETVVSSSSVAPTSSETVVSSSSVEYQDACITYVHGAGGYADNCYKAGLTGMKEGVCYKLNPARVAEYGNSLYINGTAYDTYWWEETECAQVEVIPPRDPNTYRLEDKGCIAYEHGAGNYTKNCYNAGLTNMVSGKCYELIPARKADQVNAQYINPTVTDPYWWQETLCQDTVLLDQPANPSAPEPKVKSIAADNSSLSVVSAAADVKTLRVFDMNGKLLHSETFTGMVKDVDFAKFAGKGVRLVRITSGNKLIAMKRVSVR
ncbi:MAG: T9SS type A sorting domain-containing protein [Fibrobacter sp.]|nr:T9SS type A sorting domain-containing protein [Fibrobacter sp.]